MKGTLENMRLCFNYYPSLQQKEDKRKSLPWDKPKVNMPFGHNSLTVIFLTPAQGWKGEMFGSISDNSLSFGLVSQFWMQVFGLIIIQDPHCMSLSINPPELVATQVNGRRLEIVARKLVNQKISKSCNPQIPLFLVASTDCLLSSWRNNNAWIVHVTNIAIVTNGGQETNGPVRYFIVMLLFWTLIDTIGQPGPGSNPKQYQQAISLSALALLAFALTSASASAVDWHYCPGGDALC